MMTLELLDGHSMRRIDAVRSVVAADASGMFGLMPGHEALVTVLEPGLLRYRCGGADAPWIHAACVGGLLRGADNHVRIVSRRFLSGDSPEQLQLELERLLTEEYSLRLSARTSQAKIELALLQRMQQLAQHAP
ncbi:MAG: F0F1 ATP synthase subunit epsilon [Leptothrix sp. (in: b-proteobacteria)]